MNDRNPYLAPQAALSTQSLPVATAALPRQMLLVAAGMKLLLWGILISVGGYLLALFLGMYVYNSKVAEGVQGRAQPGGPDMRHFELRINATANGLRTRAIVYGIVGFIGNIVSLIGMYQCSQVPPESGARRAARWAFFGSLVLLLLGIAINVIKLMSRSALIETLLELGYVILCYITLRIFLRFLQHTANYTSDPESIRQSNLLVRLVLMIFGMVASIVVLSLVIVLANVAGSTRLSLGLLSVILIVVAIACSLWAVFLYIRLLRRLKRVIVLGCMT